MSKNTENKTLELDSPAKLSKSNLNWRLVLDCSRSSHRALAETAVKTSGLVFSAEGFYVAVPSRDYMTTIKIDKFYIGVAEQDGGYVRASFNTVSNSDRIVEDTLVEAERQISKCYPERYLKNIMLPDLGGGDYPVTDLRDTAEQLSESNPGLSKKLFDIADRIAEGIEVERKFLFSTAADLRSAYKIKVTASVRHEITFDEEE